LVPHWRQRSRARSAQAWSHSTQQQLGSTAQTELQQSLSVHPRPTCGVKQLRGEQSGLNSPHPVTGVVHSGLRTNGVSLQRLRHSLADSEGGGHVPWVDTADGPTMRIPAVRHRRTCTGAVATP
jgi:hypothetical protein